VILLGAKNKAEVQEEMKNADVFVLTSRTAADGDMEGLPVSLIEAHAAGLPVISTRHSGIPELVEDGTTGLLSDEGDIREIAGSMLRLLSDRELRERFSMAARGRIRKEFNIETLNDELGDILENGAGRGAAHRLLKERLKSRNWEYKFERYRDAFSHMNILRDVDRPALSIVIISWRLHPLTIQNLELLEKQKDRNFELIFVNNGGHDGEFDSLNPYIDTYIKLMRNTGAYLARNIGALFTKAPVLLFLEDDGIPNETLVEAHVRLHERYDIIAARGVYRASEDSPYKRYAAHYDLGATPFPIFADLEGNTSYRADVFFAAGGWDDDIEFGGGGVDLAIRLLELEPDRRKQIYSPDPVLLHEYAKSGEHLYEKRKKQTRSHQRLQKKHPSYADHLNGWREFVGRADAIPVRHGIGKTWGDPLVSVCIPSYNRAGFLKEAIESVLRQDYANYEIVVVDDGSEDRTAETVDAFRSDKIRYFRNETNSGRPFSRNRCIEKANGSYLLWLDDDDMLEPHTLRRYAERISSTGGTADVLYGNMKIIGADGRETGRLLIPTDYTGKGSKLLANILTGGGTLVPNPGSMVKKSVYERHGGYRSEYVRAQDADFWLRISNTTTFSKLNESVAMYREHENNISLGACIDTTYESRIMIELMERYGLRTLAGVLKLQNDREIFFTILAKRFYEFRNYTASHRILSSIKNGRLIREDYPILCLSLLGMGKYGEIGRLLDSHSDMFDPADREKYKLAAESYAKLEEYREKSIDGGISVHARNLADTWGMNCDVAYVLARGLENEGRYPEAYRYARTAFQSHPAESLYYGLYYKLSRRLKKEDEAAAMLGRISETSAYIDTFAEIYALWNNGETAEELNRRAEKHIEAGDTGNARDLILSALEKDVEHADYLNNLAVVEIMDKHYQSAALLLKQIIARDPNNETAKENLGYLETLGGLSNAIESSENYINDGQYGEARKLLQELLSVDPKNLDALNNLSVVYILEEKYPQAADVLRTILEIEPAHESARQNLEYLENLPPSETIQKDEI
jgi:glycosyltransferase involved in cell wall biosynthesis/thioredoxin-like negative regulator of GroEL